MMDDPRERPVTTHNEVDRTGRDQQVAGLEATDGQARRPEGLDDDDAPEGGIDSADFPGAGAP